MKLNDKITFKQARKIPIEVELECLQARAAWVEMARGNQLPPQGMDWFTWFLMAGRGFGKTRVGAEDTWFWGFENAGTRIGVIAPTQADIRDTCIEGESGLLNVIPACLIEDYKSSLSEIVLLNGTVIKGFSAEKPDRLRGPQHHRVWCDEVAAWVDGEEVWDMAMFGLRLGENPQAVVTGTPKPTDLVRRLVKDKTTFVTNGTTFENRSNLSRKFFEQIKQYEGTTIGRQELYGELIDLEEQGIFKRSWFKLWSRKKHLPAFELIIQSYDTAFTDKTSNDPTGCITFGVFKPEDSERMCVMILDCWTDHLQYPDLKARLIEEAKYQYGANDKPVDIIIVENKGSGQDIINDLRSSTVLPLYAYNPLRADKAARAHSVSYIPCNGLVYVPESEVQHGKPRDWIEPMMHQLCAFPNTKHDEYVDCMSQALALIRDQGWLLSESEKDPDDKYIDREERVSYNSRSNPYAQ